MSNVTNIPTSTMETIENHLDTITAILADELETENDFQVKEVVSGTKFAYIKFEDIPVGPASEHRNIEVEVNENSGWYTFYSDLFIDGSPTWEGLNVDYDI